MKLFKNTRLLTISGIFQILVGAGMLGIWSSFLLKGEIPELHAEPLRIAAHLVAETVTAILLLVSGCQNLLKWKQKQALYYVSYGALIYTLITSPGYFAQLAQWAPAALFLILLTITVVLLLVPEKQTLHPHAFKS